MDAEQQIDRDTRADHARAVGRGLRVRDIADDIIDGLIGSGIAPRDPDSARVIIFDVLVTRLYPGVAVDVPTLRRDELMDRR